MGGWIKPILRYTRCAHTKHFFIEIDIRFQCASSTGLVAVSKCKFRLPVEWPIRKSTQNRNLIEKRHLNITRPYLWSNAIQQTTFKVRKLWGPRSMSFLAIVENQVIIYYCIDIVVDKIRRWLDSKWLDSDWGFYHDMQISWADCGSPPIRLSDS